MGDPGKRCPKCGMRCFDRHCQSPTCTWRLCKKCKLAFNGSGQSMRVK